MTTTTNNNQRSTTAADCCGAQAFITGGVVVSTLVAWLVPLPLLLAGGTLTLMGYAIYRMAGGGR